MKKKTCPENSRAGRCPGFGILFGLLLASAAGCSPKDIPHYYLVAEQVQQAENTTLTVTIVRRFEKENWCRPEAERYRKNGLKADCLFEVLQYEPFFRGEPTGQWYVLQRVGRFPPTVLVYEFDPPLPDAVMAEQLARSAPGVLKFAAVFGAPAEVRIFSPEGEVPWGEKKKPFH